MKVLQEETMVGTVKMSDLSLCNEFVLTFHTVATWEISPDCSHFWLSYEKQDEERSREAEWINNKVIIVTAAHLFTLDRPVGGLCNEQDDKLAGWSIKA